MNKSVFADHHNKVYDRKYRATIVVDRLVGGTPLDSKVAERWLETKIADRDDLKRERIAEIMAEHEVTADEALKQYNELANLNGFPRDPEKGLYFEGRKVKACIKEAANIALGAGHINSRGWGKTNKGSKAFIAEHIFVPENRIYLGMDKPTDIQQRFVHTYNGNGIQNEEYIDNAVLEFTVLTDAEDFDEDFWATVWVTGEQNGIGSVRSQGFGRFKVTKWDRL